MSEFSLTLKRINDYIDENVSLDIRSEDKLLEGQDEYILSNQNIINNKEATINNIIFKGSETNRVYAQSKFAIYNSDSVGIIKWIEVHNDIRGIGLSRLLRKEVLSFMDDVDEIYTNIVDSKLISIAIDQGFRQIRSNNEMNGWFVREE